MATLAQSKTKRLTISRAHTYPRVLRAVGYVRSSCIQFVVGIKSIYRREFIIYSRCVPCPFMTPTDATMREPTMSKRYLLRYRWVGE